MTPDPHKPSYLDQLRAQRQQSDKSAPATQQSARQPAQMQQSAPAPKTQQLERPHAQTQHSENAKYESDILAMAADGRKTKEIVAALIARGVPKFRAERMVRMTLNPGAYAASVEPAEPAAPPGFWGTWPGKIAGIAIVYLLLNAVLYGAQEVYHWSEMTECEKLEAKINSQVAEIETLDRALQTRDEELKKLEALVKDLDARKAKGESGPSFDKDVDRHNSLADVFNAGAEKADQQIDRMKVLEREIDVGVTKYNSFVNKAYSRWYLIPIPLPRFGSKGKFPGLPK
jgi:hypothetical protein